MTPSALRAKILAEAIGILYAEGPRHVTMRSLAEKLGYSAATIYLHFRNKDELIYEIGLYGYDQLAQSLEPSLEIDDPALALADSCRRYIDFGLEHYQLYRLMFTDIAPQQSEQSPEMLARILRSREIALTLYRRGIEQGAFRKTDPETETIVGWSMLHGFVQLAAEGRMPPGPDGAPMEARAMRDRMVEARLAALRP